MFRAGAGSLNLSPSPHQAVDVKGLRRRIERALARISNTDLLVLTFRYMSDWTCTEIADVHSVPVTTIEGRLFRARRQLRGRLESVVQEGLDAERLSDDFASNIVALVREYERQFHEDPSSADHALLRVAEPELVGLKQRTDWSSEEARAAHDFCVFVDQN